MELPHPHSSTIATMLTTLLLSIAMSPACADSWVMLTPAANAGSSITVNSRSALATIDPATDQLTHQLAAQQITQLAGFTQTSRSTANGFLTPAFRRPAPTGKVAKVLSALGLDAILQQALVRDLLGRVHGSRFCLTGGCGLNLKMSISKPGLRLEHHF